MSNSVVKKVHVNHIIGSDCLPESNDDANSEGGENVVEKFVFRKNHVPNMNVYPNMKTVDNDMNNDENIQVDKFDNNIVNENSDVVENSENVFYEDRTRVTRKPEKLNL